MISKELIAASTKPIILAILQGGPNYGYALVQKVKQLSEEHIEWSEGMLYPVLHRLEQDGLIESEWITSETGKRRKYYRLRGSGRTALAREREQWSIVNTTLEKLWKTARLTSITPC